MHNTKDVEKMLYKYKKIPLIIKKLELEIEITKHTYDGIKGKSNNEIMPGSKTNNACSLVENSLIDKESRIDKLTEDINKLMFEERAITLALSNLTDVEFGIISDKYFNHMSYYKVGKKHYFSKEWAYYTCRKIIKEKIMPFMVSVNEY